MAWWELCYVVARYMLVCCCGYLSGDRHVVAKQVKNLLCGEGAMCLVTLAEGWVVAYNGERTQLHRVSLAALPCTIFLCKNTHTCTGS